MNEHLSSEQILKWFSGACSADEQRHASQCPECRAEVERLQSTLLLYRDSVHQWSGWQTRTANDWKPAPEKRWIDSGLWRIALVVTATLVLAVLPFYRSTMLRAQRAERARQDAILLERVDAELSRSVPASMEPLLKLVSLNGASDSQEYPGAGTRNGGGEQ